MDGKQVQVALEEGDYSRARQMLEESLEIRRRLGYLGGIGVSLCDLGLLACVQKDYLASRDLFTECLPILRDIRDLTYLPCCIDAVGVLTSVLGAPLTASHLWGAAERLRQETGSHIEPQKLPSYKQEVAAARLALGDAIFDGAWEEGRAMTLEQAVAYALEELGD